MLHAQYEGETQTQPTLNLLGTVFIDISAFVCDQSNTSKQNFVSGYYHIINKGMVRSSQDLAFLEPNQLSKQSQGQLKVTIRSERQKPSSPDSALQTSTPGPLPKAGMSSTMRDEPVKLEISQDGGRTVPNPFRGTQTFGNDRPTMTNYERKGEDLMKS